MKCKGRKVFSILLCLVLCAGLLCACENGGSGGGSGEGGDSDSIVIRFAHIENDFTASAQGC